MIITVTRLAADGGEPAVHQRAHHVPAPGQGDQRDQRERDAERQHHLGDHQAAGGRQAEFQDQQGGQHGDRAAQEQRDAAADEALHDHLARVGAHAGGRQARGEQRRRERQRGAAADQPAQLGVRRRQRTQLDAAGLAGHRGRHDQHGQVDQPGRAERDDHVEPLEAEQFAALRVVDAVHPGLGQRGVQVDDVRHHGGPDDARHQQRARRARGSPAPGRWPAPTGPAARPRGRRRTRGRRCRAGRTMASSNRR